MIEPVTHPILHRRQVFQAKLASHQIVLLSKPTDVHYYTGFEFLVPEEREAFAVITPLSSYLVYGAFSPLPPSTEGLELKTGCSISQLVDHLKAISATLPVGTIEILFDATDLRVNEHQALASLGQPATTLTPLDLQLIWDQRLYKDSTEITALKKAGQIAQQALKIVQSTLKPGMSEQAVKQLLDRTMEDLGSQRPAFPTIVAFGAHGAAPHHQPSFTTLLEPETPLLLDFGATVDGYRSDMTRSFWFGEKPSTQFLAIEKIIQQAYQAAYSEVAKILNNHTGPLVTAKTVDTAARNLITEAGYGKHFIHTTGHGVGLEIHELPSLSWRNEQPIKTNMVLTIEPGIYLENEFGYRYENTIVVTPTHLEEITN